MEAPGSIFALNKAAQNVKFSKAIADKYENAGTTPYADTSLVFLNLKQNQILQANTEETIQIIYRLMLQWNNRQDFPLARTTVFSHIRENIEHDLQTLSRENKELYRELNFIWQEIRVLDRKEASSAAKKRARRQQDYLQRERRKWDEKIQKNLTLISQAAVKVPAELRPADVRNAIVHQLGQEQSLRTEIRETGIAGKETSETEASEAKPFRIKTETRLRNFSEIFTGFIYRDSFHELYRMLEHRLSDKTVLEHQLSGMELPLPGKVMQQPLPNETQKMILQKQIPAGDKGAPVEIRETPAGIRETPAGIQNVDRIVSRQANQQISRRINRQLLQTEEHAHRITEIREEGITETEFLEKEIPGTGTPGARPLGTETETRLRNLSEIFTGFIYRDSFRELYRMLEHRLPKTAPEHRLPGEANQQINRRLLQIEKLPHRITEIREAKIPGSETLRTEIRVTGILGIDPLRTEPETRLRSLGELFTSFIYRGSFRELHRMLEHRLPDKTMLEHQMPDKTMLEHQMPGETQRMIRQNQISTEVQEVPAGIREISAGIQTVNRIVNRQMSQQVNRQMSQQVNQQINQQMSRQLMQTEALTRRAEENLFRQIRLSENIIKAARVESLLSQITVRDDVHLLNTISKRQSSNSNISAVITQNNAQRQFDIRQRDILTYNEAEPAPASKRADPALTGYPAPTTAQTLKTQASSPAQPLKYLAKEQSARKPSGQGAFLNPIRTELQYLKKKETAGAEALREQKQNVKVLMEKINIQEQVIDQMKNTRQGQNTALGKAEVKMVADTVLERLYKDIHLQRLRMGMS